MVPLSDRDLAGVFKVHIVKKRSLPESVLKVLVVEDSADLQLLLRAMLHEIPSVEVVASVDTQDAAIEAIQNCRADLAIVDLELESGTGLGILKIISESLNSSNQLKVVVFSNYSNLVIRHRCLSLGAKAFFDKSFQIDELLAFVQDEALDKSKSLSV